VSSQPLVSIVLPTYNGSRYLSEAIASILAQGYERWELVVVDDASTDTTPEIVASFARKDPRIRAARNSENRRLPGSLNVGCSLASGDLLTWTSDDNWYYPEAIGALVEWLLSHPEIGVVYGDFTEVSGDGTFRRHVTRRDAAALAFYNVIGPCFLYRRAVQQQLGGYAEDMFLAEDYDFWLRASRYFRFGRLAQDLYGYRVHEGSLSHTKGRAVAEAHERVLFQNLPHLPWLARGTRAMAYMELARRALWRGDRHHTVYPLWRGVLESPLIMFENYRSRYGLLTAPEAEIPRDEDDRLRGCRGVEGAPTFWELLAYGLAGPTGQQCWRRLVNVANNPGQTLRRKLRAIVGSRR
jgi:glycosyltransferase involved in cell wall biosynthesis